MCVVDYSPIGNSPIEANTSKRPDKHTVTLIEDGGGYFTPNLDGFKDSQDILALSLRHLEQDAVAC